MCKFCWRLKESINLTHIVGITYNSGEVPTFALVNVKSYFGGLKISEYP